jgi:hypothetical protein
LFHFVGDIIRNTRPSPDIAILVPANLVRDKLGCSETPAVLAKLLWSMCRSSGGKSLASGQGLLTRSDFDAFFITLAVAKTYKGGDPNAVVQLLDTGQF